MRHLAFLTSLFIAACSACRAPTPVVRPYAAPSASELLQVVSTQQRTVRAMNARVRATSWLNGERVRATVLMLVERAGKLRFEAEINLQGTVAVLVTDGTEFALLDVNKNVLRRGPACPENVASLIRIPLRTDEVAAILLGDVALGAGALHPELAQVGWDDRAGTDVLDIPGDAGRLKASLKRRGSGGWDLVGVVREDTSGAPQWRTAYESFGDVGGVRLPEVIRYAERKSSFDDGVEIKFKDRQLNPAIADASFRLLTPGGVREEQVGCGVGPEPPTP